MTPEEKRRAREALWRLTGEGCDHHEVVIIGPGAEADIMKPPYHCEGKKSCKERPVVLCTACKALCCERHAGKPCPAPRCIGRLLPRPFHHVGHVYT